MALIRALSGSSGGGGGFANELPLKLYCNHNYPSTTFTFKATDVSSNTDIETWTVTSSNNAFDISKTFSFNNKSITVRFVTNSTLWSQGKATMYLTIDGITKTVDILLNTTKETSQIALIYNFQWINIIFV